MFPLTIKIGSAIEYGYRHDSQALRLLGSLTLFAPETGHRGDELRDAPLAHSR